MCCRGSGPHPFVTLLTFPFEPLNVKGYSQLNQNITTDRGNPKVDDEILQTFGFGTLFRNVSLDYSPCWIPEMSRQDHGWCIRIQVTGPLHVKKILVYVSSFVFVCLFVFTLCPLKWLVLTKWILIISFLLFVLSFFSLTLLYHSSRGVCGEWSSLY